MESFRPFIIFGLKTLKSKKCYEYVIFSLLYFVSLALLKQLEVIDKINNIHNPSSPPATAIYSFNIV